MAAAHPVNPLALSALILLVIVTIIFTVLVIHTSSEIKVTREGNVEDRLRKQPLDKVQNELVELRGSVRSAQDLQNVRDRQTTLLDLELAKKRAYFRDDRQLTGVMAEDLEGPDGKAFKAKDSSWRMTREDVSQVSARLKAMREEHEGPERQTFPALEAAIQKRQTEQQEVMNRANEMETAFNTDKDRLTAQHEELKVASEKAQRQKRDDFSRRATKIGQQEDRIRELLELELRWMTEVEPDGSILELGVEHGFVVIDIGKADKVFPGLILAAFQYQSGHYLEKGMLEIIDVRSQIATCRVLKENDPRHYPIAQGDHVGNPVFDSHRPKVFVLAGDFENYNKEDLESFIRATGGEVREKLSPGVDFLVAGKRSERLQDNAREYQVQAMREDQLLKFVQTTFAAK